MRVLLSMVMDDDKTEMNDGLLELDSWYGTLVVWWLQMFSDIFFSVWLVLERYKYCISEM